MECLFNYATVVNTQKPTFVPIWKFAIAGNVIEEISIPSSTCEGHKNEHRDYF